MQPCSLGELDVEPKLSIWWFILPPSLLLTSSILSEFTADATFNFVLGLCILLVFWRLYKFSLGTPLEIMTLWMIMYQVVLTTIYGFRFFGLL